MCRLLVTASARSRQGRGKASAGGIGAWRRQATIFGCSVTARSCGGLDFPSSSVVTANCTAITGRSASFRTSIAALPQGPASCSGLTGEGVATEWRFASLAPKSEKTVHYLREREQATAVYLERLLPIRLQDGRTVKALSYVADRKHAQYAGRLDFDVVLKIVRQGEGISGRNPDYVSSTYEHLAGMGVIDPLLRRIIEALGETPAGSTGTPT